MMYWIGIFEFIKSLLSCVGIYAVIFKFYPRKVKLSIGSFWCFNYKYDAQTLTNTVSSKFYNGGNVPQEVRHEILILVQPFIWSLTKKNPQA